jgi:hypothetical protein
MTIVHRVMRPVLDVAAVLAENRRLASELIRTREEIIVLRKRRVFRQDSQARATIPRETSTR